MVFSKIKKSLQTSPFYAKKHTEKLSVCLFCHIGLFVILLCFFVAFVLVIGILIGLGILLAVGKLLELRKSARVVVIYGTGLLFGYGVIGKNEKGVQIVVHRVPVSTLKSRDKLEAIRHPYTRNYLLEETEGAKSANEFAQMLQSAAERRNIKSVRLQETLSVIPMGCKAYKGDSNYCYDIDTSKEKWEGRVISTFEANRPEFDQQKAPKGILRLRKGDTLRLVINGTPKLMLVRTFTEGMITMDPLFEADCDARSRRKEDFGLLRKGPSTLMPLKAERVFVDEAGFVYRR